MLPSVMLPEINTTDMNPAPNLPSDPDDKGKFGLSRYIEVSHFASHPTHSDFTPVHPPVFLVVCLGPLEDQVPGYLAGLREFYIKCRSPLIPRFGVTRLHM